MAAGENNSQSSPAVPLFQKAHGRMVMLQRVDEQLLGLLEQRRRIQEELRAVQTQINEEFERVIRQAEEVPEKILTQIADSARGNGRPAPPRLEDVAEAAA